MQKVKYVVSGVLLGWIALFQVPVYAVALQIDTVQDNSFKWTVLASCAKNQSSACSDMVDCRQSAINTSAPATDVCFAIELGTPDRFASANGTVKFSGNCTAYGFSTTPAPYNEGGQLIIYLSNPLIQKNTTVKLNLSQKDAGTKSGASAQINVNCELTQAP